MTAVKMKLLLSDHFPVQIVLCRDARHCKSSRGVLPYGNRDLMSTADIVTCTAQWLCHMLLELGVYWSLRCLFKMRIVELWNELKFTSGPSL